MRIGIVQELASAADALRSVLEDSNRHRVVWVARNEDQALARCLTDKPDLILMDLQRPGLDGVGVTRRLMQEAPCPILITTPCVGGNSADVFEALGAGALDAVNTPVPGSTDKRTNPTAFLTKLDSLAKLIRPGGTESLRRDGTATNRSGPGDASQLVAIGSSAGGPAALAAVLGALPTDFSAGIVIVQHLDEQFAAGLAAWLNQRSQLPVRVAREGDRPTAGVALLAGSTDHLLLLNGDTLGYQVLPRETPYRPSIDVLFESVVRHWPGPAVGVLLTGMGRDGARGLKALRQAGHRTFAQDQNSCAVYGMPKAAAELDAAMHILPLECIAPRLVQCLATPPMTNPPPPVSKH